MVVIFALIAAFLYLGPSRDFRQNQSSPPPELSIDQSLTGSDTPSSELGRSSDSGKAKQVHSFASRDKSRKKRDGEPPREDDTWALTQTLLHSPDAQERAAAVDQLGEMEPTQEVLLACFEALNDTEEEVRLLAVLSLEDLEQVSAIPVLRHVANEDPSEDVREAAIEAIDYLANPQG